MGEQITYDVRIWSILTNKRARGNTYTVRWVVAGQPFRSTYTTVALAESERAKLLTAAKKGEAFRCDSGLPVSQQSRLTDHTWYDFAVAYVDLKWPASSANNRVNLAKVLTPVTIAMLKRPLPITFEPVDVRTALREWAFNKNVRAEAPPEVAAILRWVARNVRKVSELAEPDVFEPVLTAIRVKLDGTPVAASSAVRSRRLLSPVLDYAVYRKALTENPMRAANSTPLAAPVKTTLEIDKRTLIGQERTQQVLVWIRRRPRGGARLMPFFATIRYAGPRPEEAVAMRVGDEALQEGKWGEILIHTAHPEVGRRWTDSGERRDNRNLKGRAEGETRRAPVSPMLTAVLLQHIEDENLKPGDRLFQGEGGGPLALSVARRAWHRARGEVLTAEEAKSKMARRIYDLRASCVTDWLNSGAPPSVVAEWAGHSVDVLLRIYYKCVEGQHADAQRRIEAAHGFTTAAGQRLLVPQFKGVPEAASN